MFKLYYNLTKPGMVYGNALPAIAGFLLASNHQINWKLFLAMIVGMSLIIASGCVFNNIADKDIDAKMERTKNRSMVNGTITKTKAIIFGIILVIFGCTILLLFTNYYALGAALIGFATYVFLYTPLKKKTQYATLIGAIAGATPPVIGYAAASGRFDVATLILFLTLFFWQMPHFYAIAIYRFKDYQQAGIPVLPAVKGVAETKIQMFLYIIGFIVAALMLEVFRYSGFLYVGVIVLIGSIWLWFSEQGLNLSNKTLTVPEVFDDGKWARKMFLVSLIVLTSLCVIISVDKLIH